MDTRRSFGRLFNRIAAAARRWAAQIHPRPAEATIPPLQPVRLFAKAEPIPADPAEHAVQFAQDWYDRLEFHSRRRMRELGIPEHRIGACDIDYDFRHAAFHPKERTGGSNSPGARINLNSGILNPELLSPELGPKVATLWGKCGLQDRMDAVIAHEHLKKGGLSMATATDGLQNALHITARVQSGNKIEITAPGLQEGQDVDVYLVPRPSETPSRRSVLEFLDSLPSGPRSAPTWDEVERRFQEERDAWDR